MEPTGSPSAPDEAQWDIAARTIDDAALQNVDAVVHLAGETIGQRWSKETKRRVLESRVEGTRLIAETAARLPSRPILVCASGAGFYGRLDGIANCVGSLLLKPAHATSEIEWSETIATNLTSAFHTIRAGTRAM